MRGQGKRYRKALEEIARVRQPCDLAVAVATVKSVAAAKFDETLEMAVRLGVDPKHADQMVRGTVVLPHGTGKTVRLVVFTKGEKEKEAQQAGADYVGCEELIDKIQKGWMEFDRAIATPDVMGQVGKLGKILGPRGLMPNPKTGTVTFDVARAVREFKGGKIEFRVEKAGIVQVPFGKASFTADQLRENALTLVEAIVRVKPASSKGKYLKGITISSTMSPGVAVDLSGLGDVARVSG